MPSWGTGQLLTPTGAGGESLALEDSKPAPTPSGDSAESPAAVEKKEYYVTSPFVGTFYRSPSRGVPPYVEVGQYVKKGQPLCIVEAMKLMNEIESDYEGKIVEIYPENAAAVEYGEKLFRIEA